MRGFRTKIALWVAFLLLVSAVITDVLVVLFAQGILVRDHMNQQRKRMEAMGLLIVAPPYATGDQVPAERAFAASGILRDSDWPALLLVDAEGETLYQRSEADDGGGTYPNTLLAHAAATTLQTGSVFSENLGLVWGVFWWQPHAALVSVPIAGEGRQSGAMAAIVPLTPLYTALRQYNKPVLIYILINTALLGLVGMYRVFRIYLRPIDRLIRQADAYGDDDDDLFFTFRREDSELNRLSSALNRMLKRIAEDQKTLKQTVARLEKANADLKQAHHEIIRSEKMAAVGRLAAGIAHEIGNPIGIVLGYLDLLKRSDLAPGEHDDFARRAEQETQRINTIITQLLDLARPKESGAGLVSVHEVILDIVAVLAPQPMMAGIDMQTQLEAHEDRVWMNGDQLRQVFLNVLLNAVDAIHEAGRGDAGRIEITTTTDTAGPAGAMRLQIAFADNGHGIPSSQIDNIFDPFYSTKDPGKGTGLGLAVSYMIIEQMGGTIRVRSRVAKGTTLTLDLPVTSGPPEQGRGPDAQPAEHDPQAEPQP